MKHYFSLPVTELQRARLAAIPALIFGFVLFPQLLQANNGPIESPISETFIKNPLATGSIIGFLEAILTIVMVLSVPVIIFFIIYAGFLYVTAQGNSEQVKQATAALTYAVVGGLIVLGALVIVEIISNLVGAFMAESN